MAYFDQEPSLVFVVPTTIAQPCQGLVHVGRENQDRLVRFRYPVEAFYPFHRQAFLAWRIRPSRVQLTDQALMVSEWSGFEQLTQALRMWSCQRRKSVGVVFMGLGFSILVMSTKWSGYWLSFSTTSPSSSTVILQQSVPHPAASHGK